MWNKLFLINQVILQLTLACCVQINSDIIIIIIFIIIIIIFIIIIIIIIIIIFPITLCPFTTQ